MAAAVFFLDEQRGWLFVEVQTRQQPGDNTNYDRGLTRSIYTTNDGGQHWSRLVAAPQSGGSVLGTVAVGCAATGLTFVSLDIGWLTFDCINNQPGGANLPVVVQTHDGGLSWNSLPLPSVSGALCRALRPIFSQNLGVFPLTCYNGGRSGIYATADGGRTWTFYPLPDSALMSNFIDGKNGWAMGSDGNAYRTTNSGRTWSHVGRLAAPPHQTVGNIQFLNTKVGFATTSLMMGPLTFFRTRDGGRTWAEVQEAPVASQS